MPKNRSRRIKGLRRRGPIRPPFDRVLIVCEGKKTEPNYFGEIRIQARISTTHIKIINGEYGTQPLQIVEFAIDEFKKSRTYDRVYAVFDRDDHNTYANAISKAEAHNKKLKNDENKSVILEAVTSVPCFELWLLLHFADIRSWLHRDEVLSRLKRFIANYDKGSNDIYAKTSRHWDTAYGRASRLKQNFSRLPGNDAYTDVHELVALLRTLKR